MQIAAISFSMPAPLPLLARAVRAGFPSPADDFIEEEIDLQRLLVTNRAATFLVRVAGDSMVGKGLFDGDLAIVDRSMTPQDGDVVVVGRRRRAILQGLGPPGRPGYPFLRQSCVIPRTGSTPEALVEVWGVVSGSVNPRRRAVRG